MEIGVAVHVDNGLMRSGESREVGKTFRGLGVDLVVVKARDRFLERLRGSWTPRRIIGEDFIRVFEEGAEKVGPSTSSRVPSTRIG